MPKSGWACGRAPLPLLKDELRSPADLTKYVEKLVALTSRTGRLGIVENYSVFLGRVGWGQLQSILTQS